MTNLSNSISTRAVAAILTIVFSAVTVLGAVGPAYTGKAPGQQVAAGIDNVAGKSANSLA